MKWIPIISKGRYTLLQSESDTQYVVAANYDADAPENEQWTAGTYFCYFENSERKLICLQEALDELGRLTDEHYVDKRQKYLEIYREDYPEGTFNEILSSLHLDNDQVGNAFGVYCVIDEDSLKKGEENESNKRN